MPGLTFCRRLWRGTYWVLVKLWNNNGVNIILQTHTVFTHMKHGSTHLLDNKSAMQQAQGVHIVHHKTLPQKNITTLLNHNVCCMLYPMENLNRLILVVLVMFGIRSSAMVDLTLNKFNCDSLNSRKGIIFKEKVGSCTGASKQNEGGRAAIKKLCSNSCFWCWSTGRALECLQLPWWLS